MPAVQLQNIAVNAKKDKHLLKELWRRLSLFLPHTLMKYVLHIGPSPVFSLSLSSFLVIESIVHPLCLTCEKVICYVERPNTNI